MYITVINISKSRREKKNVSSIKKDKSYLPYSFNSTIEIEKEIAKEVKAGGIRMGVEWRVRKKNGDILKWKTTRDNRVK
tara:strand:+ start:76 stop:312 length:237 start_codon:yes stop_codon:yes gene_type:complete